MFLTPISKVLMPLAKFPRMIGYRPSTSIEDEANDTCVQMATHALRYMEGPDV